MQVKTFEAFNMKDAIKAVKAEFGQDAVILKTSEKNVEANGLKKVYEVTAAVPDSPRQHGATVRESSRFPDEDLFRKISALETKINYLSEEVALKSQLNRIDAGFEELKVLIFESLKSKGDSDFSDVSKAVADICVQLRLMGVDDVHVSKLKGHLAGLTVNDADEGEEKYYKAQAIRWMLKRIKIAPKWIPASDSPMIHCFMGPTGTGKTTLVAKLAAHFSRKEKKKVLVLSVDHQRLASSEQMRLYAKILGVPFKELTSLSDLEAIIESHREYDYILLDTAGRSPKSANTLDDFKPVIEGNLPIDCHLVLSATDKQTQMDRSVRRFSEVGISSLIFSKLDECWNYGEMFNLTTKWSIPLSYFSVGQRIPDDIERASRERVVERIFGL